MKRGVLNHFEKPKVNDHDFPATQPVFASSKSSGGSIETPLPGPSEPRPFGPVATLIFGAVIILAIEVIGGNLATLILAYWAQLHGATIPEDPAELTELGSFVALMQPFKVVLAVTGLAVLAILRKLPWSQYYGRLRFAWRQGWVWLLGMIVLLVLCDLSLLLLDQPVVLAWMIAVYETAGWMPFFIFALCVLAPIYEELFFRGFLIAGFEQSRLGAAGGVVISSVLWAAIHFQYPLYGITLIFVMGIFLGAAWVVTRSLGLVIVLHGFANALALAQTAYFAESQ